MNSEEKGSISDLLKVCSSQWFLPKGQTIMIPGDKDSSIYFIEKGAVRFALNSYTGDEKILYILGPGSFFNEETLFQPFEVGIHVYCEEECEILKIDSSVYTGLLGNKVFVQAIFQGMVRKNHRMRQEIEDISFKSCKQRILNIFAKECNKERIYDQNWYDVKKRYTHQDLAGIIGANRVTVSKLIGELCEEYQLRNLNRRIQIHKSAVERNEEEYGI